MPWNSDYHLSTFYTDEPHESPELNFGVYAEQLCKIVTRATNLKKSSSIDIANGCGGVIKSESSAQEGMEERLSQ